MIDSTSPCSTRTRDHHAEWLKRKKTYEDNPEKKLKRAKQVQNAVRKIRAKVEDPPAQLSPQAIDLLAIKQSWSKLYPTERRRTGIQVLDKLLENVPESLPKFQYKCTRIPTAGHVMEDVQTHGDKNRFFHFHGSYQHTSFNFHGFNRAWAALAEDVSANITHRTLTPLTAFDFPATVNGLLDCEIQLPTYLKREEVFVSPVAQGTTLSDDNSDSPSYFSTIATPAGTIIDICDNCILTASALIVVVGEKLLFTWPNTPENREYYKTHHGTQNSFALLQAIDRMSGLKATVLRKGEGVIMERGMIHVVLSPVNSAVSRWIFVDSKWLEEGHEAILSDMKWELDLFKTRKQHPVSIDQPSNSMTDVLQFGVNMWKHLCKRMKIKDQRVEKLIEDMDKLVSTKMKTQEGDKTRTKGHKRKQK